MVIKHEQNSFTAIKNYYDLFGYLFNAPENLYYNINDEYITLYDKYL